MVICRETAAAKKEELKKAEELLMEARRQELLNEEDGYWRQRMDQQQLVEKLKAEVAEQQEELKGQSEVFSSALLCTLLARALTSAGCWLAVPQRLPSVIPHIGPAA